MKNFIILIALGFIFNPHFVKAGCDPCICGPGGDFQGDLDAWWKLNCPHKPRQSRTIKCISSEFPPKMGSLFTLNVYSDGVFGSSRLEYNDGQPDILKKAWASYNFRNVATINEMGQHVHFGKWGGGTLGSYLPSYTAMPYAVSVYPESKVTMTNKTMMRIGIFSVLKDGNKYFKTESIYTYSCQNQ